MSSAITLTTDFGLQDAYVASIKGVILGINPDAKLVDICHTIKPQNIAEAAFILSTVYQSFSKKTIHLVVVDPEVGTERRAIILKTPLGLFVAPDNGVLSYIIQESLASPVTEKGAVSIRGGLKPGAGIEVVHINKPEFWRSPLSPTFHGRDVFAPVVALLSLGFPPIQFGEPVSSVEMLPQPRPIIRPDGSLLGHILHIDSFGNIITNIRSEDIIQQEQPVAVEVGQQLISGLCHTYAEGSGLIALIGSSGYLEVSLKGGNASSLLDAKVGDEVRSIQQKRGNL
jgi:S-adenosylmethionine hydrolase